MYKKLLCTTAFALFAVTAAQSAVNISNTGVDSSWSVSYNGGAPVTATKVTTPVWSLANTASSSWISINAAGTPNATGPYTYTTSFTFSGVTSFTFKYAVDDYVTAILLDGVAVTPSGFVGGSYDAFTSYTLDLSAVKAANPHTLGFQTLNLDPNQGIANPSGFRLEAAVPEPSTWAMMVGGFGMLGFAMRRQRASTTTVIA